jgi:hypothetical protein
MTIKDIFKRSYDIRVKCLNCGAKIIMKVPKGTTVEDFANDKMGKCDYCGCVVDIEEYETEWLK